MAIYEHVSELMTQTASLETDVKNLQTETDVLETKMKDSGWKNLSLATGVVAYSAAQVPQYRKIGNVVYLRGACKGFTANDTVIAVLPAGFRPPVLHSFPQNTSKSNDVPMFARWSIKTNGEIVMQNTEINTPTVENWYPIATQFLVD